MIVELLLLLAIALCLGVAVGCAVYLHVYRDDPEPPGLREILGR